MRDSEGKPTSSSNNSKAGITKSAEATEQELRFDSQGALLSRGEQPPTRWVDDHAQFYVPPGAPFASHGPVQTSWQELAAHVAVDRLAKACKAVKDLEALCTVHARAATRKPPSQQQPQQQQPRQQQQQQQQQWPVGRNDPTGNRRASLSPGRPRHEAARRQSGSSPPALPSNPQQQLMASNWPAGISAAHPCTKGKKRTVPTRKPPATDCDAGHNSQAQPKRHSSHQELAEKTRLLLESLAAQPDWSNCNSSSDCSSSKGHEQRHHGRPDVEAAMALTRTASDPSVSPVLATTRNSALSAVLTRRQSSVPAARTRRYASQHYGGSAAINGSTSIATRKAIAGLLAGKSCGSRQGDASSN